MSRAKLLESALSQSLGLWKKPTYVEPLQMSNSCKSIWRILMSPFPQIARALHLAVSWTLQLRSKHGKAWCLCLWRSMGTGWSRWAASFIGNVIRSLECKVTGKPWIWFSFFKRLILELTGGPYFFSEGKKNKITLGWTWQANWKEGHSK